MRRSRGRGSGCSGCDGGMMAELLESLGKYVAGFVALFTIYCFFFMSGFFYSISYSFARFFTIADFAPLLFQIFLGVVFFLFVVEFLGLIPEMMHGVRRSGDENGFYSPKFTRPIFFFSLLSLVIIFLVLPAHNLFSWMLFPFVLFIISSTDFVKYKMSLGKSDNRPLGQIQLFWFVFWALSMGNMHVSSTIDSPDQYCARLQLGSKNFYGIHLVSGSDGYLFYNVMSNDVLFVEKNGNILGSVPYDRNWAIIHLFDLFTNQRTLDMKYRCNFLSK
jgi:hypothetical protein